MSSNRATKRIVILVILLAAAVLVPGALAQGDYQLSSWTVDGGGTYTGGDYSLAGTTGQYEAVTWSGDGYALVGGFWQGTEYQIFLPLVMRNH